MRLTGLPDGPAKKEPMNCKHGEIETSVARSTITCRICGATATLPARPDPDRLRVMKGDRP
jgi:hypothetical protein